MPVDPAARSEPSDDPDTVSVRLMGRVREGDERAFRELVELHQQAVIGTCAKMLGSLDEAHDVAQLVFLRVWKAAPRYVPTAKFTTWLYTILRHLVFNETRRKSRHRTVSLDAPVSDEQHHPHDLADALGLPRCGLASSRTRSGHRRRDQPVAGATAARRILRRYEDLAYEEIAEVLKTSVPAVKSLLFRARTEFASRLARLV